MAIPLTPSDAVLLQRLIETLYAERKFTIADYIYTVAVRRAGD